MFKSKTTATQLIKFWNHYAAGIMATGKLCTTKACTFTASASLLLTIICAAPVSAQFVLATIPTGAGPNSMAVNPVTNRIYVANAKGNSLSVIDGATSAVIATLPMGSTPRGIAINIATNRIYIANALSTDVKVVDGTTNTLIATVFHPGMTRTEAIAINPASNTAFTESNTRTVYYQLDTKTGPWKRAAGTSELSASFSNLPPGKHVLFAYASGNLEGVATGGSAANGAGFSPVVGAVQAFEFTVVSPPIALGSQPQTISGFAPPTAVLFGAAPLTLSATGGGSNNPVVFGTTSAPTICRVTGNLLTFVGPGMCDVTANQFGSVEYANAAPVAASVGIIGATTFAPLPASLRVSESVSLIATEPSGLVGFELSTSDPKICRTYFNFLPISCIPAFVDSVIPPANPVCSTQCSLSNPCRQNFYLEGVGEGVCKVSATRRAFYELSAAQPTVQTVNILKRDQVIYLNDVHHRCLLVIQLRFQLVLSLLRKIPLSSALPARPRFAPLWATHLPLQV